MPRAVQLLDRKAALTLCAAGQVHQPAVWHCGSRDRHAVWPAGVAEAATGCAHLPLRLCLVGPLGPGGVQQARLRSSCQLTFLTRHVNAQKLVRLRHTAGVSERIAPPDKARDKGRGVLAQNSRYAASHQHILWSCLPNAFEITGPLSSGNPHLVKLVIPCTMQIRWPRLKCA